jgi:hypothetical protein
MSYGSFLVDAASTIRLTFSSPAANRKVRSWRATSRENALSEAFDKAQAESKGTV